MNIFTAVKYCCILHGFRNEEDATYAVLAVNIFVFVKLICFALVLLRLTECTIWRLYCTFSNVSELFCEKLVKETANF